jgi:hypothetical protein
MNPPDIPGLTQNPHFITAMENVETDIASIGVIAGTGKEDILSELRQFYALTGTLKA